MSEQKMDELEQDAPMAAEEQSTEEVVEEVAEEVADSAEPVSEEAPEEEAVAEEAPVEEAPVEEAPAEPVADESATEEAEEPAAPAEPEPVKVAAPAEYVPSVQRGRSRRIRVRISMREISYRNIPLLTRFLDPYGRILSRRKTGVSAKMQRKAVREIKRARHLSLLPYTGDHTRVARLKRRR